MYMYILYGYRYTYAHSNHIMLLKRSSESETPSPHIADCSCRVLEFGFKVYGVLLYIVQYKGNYVWLQG